MHIKEKILVFTVILFMISCSRSIKDSDLEEFAKTVFLAIECPNVPRSFGSFSVCAKSYEVTDDIININMTWSPDYPMILPLEKWDNEGKIEKFMREIVCNAIAANIGVTDETILGNELGVIQKAHIKVGNEEYREELKFAFASRARLTIDISHGNYAYTLTHLAYQEADQGPFRCSVERQRKLSNNRP